ncbi:MAG: hypothetical protein SFX72_20260 [Isosphaeraceae bacterium]|nr:hypothetical protein [Isosphaeraceae bacterium]
MTTPNLGDSRNRGRRRLGLRASFDNLESRRLCAAGPNEYEQYMLALINRARANPAAEAQRLVQLAQTDPVLIQATQDWDLNAFAARMNALPALPPLAFNTRLAEAATVHNAWMASINGQDHSPAGFLTNPLIARASDGRAFYDVRRAKWVTAENVFAFSENVVANSTIDYVEYFHAAFLIDWGNPDFGHLRNLMAPGPSRAKRNDQPLSEIGIDLATNVIPSVPPVSDPANPANEGFNVGPAMVTQEFGWRSTAKPFVTGAVFHDRDADAFYDPTEGLGGVTIRATRKGTRKSWTTTTWDSGGFSLPLASGVYTITASGGAVEGSWSSVVRVRKDNVAWDLALGSIASGVSSLGSADPSTADSGDVGSPPSAPAPVSAGRRERGVGMAGRASSSFTIDVAPAASMFQATVDLGVPSDGTTPRRRPPLRIGGDRRDLLRS